MFVKSCGEFKIDVCMKRLLEREDLVIECVSAHGSSVLFFPTFFHFFLMSSYRFLIHFGFYSLILRVVKVTARQDIGCVPRIDDHNKLRILLFDGFTIDVYERKRKG